MKEKKHPEPATKPDMQPDSDPAPMDAGESPGWIEPVILSSSAKRYGELVDLALDLTRRSAGLTGRLPPSLAPALADMVRAMNCYYSNLIEGHDTHPIDIERALRKDFSQNPRQRDLQLEAAAHIAVQRWIDEGNLFGRALTSAGLNEIHRRFCAALPDSLLVSHPDAQGFAHRIEPGCYRRYDVQVGLHIPVSPGAVPRFMRRFEEAHAGLSRTDRLIAAATAHHRLLWIHPYLDGNGRVARLMSHALLFEILETGSLWSVARGLARNTASYKAHLQACDLKRRNDLDGRGHLSEETLVEFAIFFLKTALDQVDFMSGLIQPDGLQSRIRQWAERQQSRGSLPAHAIPVLDAVQYRGSLPRADIAAIAGVGDRQARRITAALEEFGVLKSESHRAPLTLAFPATVAGDWFPGLFPDKPST